MQPSQLMPLALVPAAVGYQRQEPCPDEASQAGRQGGVVTGVEIAVVPVVAAEQLVAAVAAEDHLDVPPGGLGHEVRADRERIGRLVEMMNQRRQVADQRWYQHLFMVVRAITLRDQASRRRLVMVAQGQAQGEGGHRAGGCVGSRHCHHQGGVEAPAQECTDRHVADHVQAHRLDHLVLERSPAAPSRCPGASARSRDPNSREPRCPAPVNS